MNGYVGKSGQKFLWVAKRSDFKPTYPGRLDHLVAGGLVRKFSLLKQFILSVYIALLRCRFKLQPLIVMKKEGII